MVAAPAPFRIRPMQLPDLPAVMQIERAVMHTPWSEAGYRHELTANELAHYLALFEGDELIGHAGYWLVAGEAQVSIIAVAPERQRKGLGGILLRALLDDAARRGAAQAQLEVRRSNLPAQRLYHAFGFQIVGERAGYYSDTGEDALLMNLDLSEEYAPAAGEARQRVVQERFRKET